MCLIEKLNFIIPPKQINGSKNFDLEIVSDGSKIYDPAFKIDSLKKTVTIYIASLSSKENRKLKAILRDDFKNDEIYLIEDIKAQLFDNLYKYKSENKDGSILKFFKPILSNHDYLALRDSLFLRSRFVQNEDVRLLKKDIRYRYGERGNSISNLCTAGYFENIMIPLYNKDKTEFFQYYDIAVDRGITALFVNSKMQTKEIKSEIKRKINSAKSYGQLKTFHIHGIGKLNISNIKKCLVELKKEITIVFIERNVFLDNKTHIFVVEIIL